MTLEGRRVLVTGASSGIGRATAVALDAAGARVAVLARREELLDDLVAELDRAVATPADVTDPEAVAAAVGAAAGALGGLDGLVNAAGVARPAPVLDGAPGDWRAMLEVNVLGLLIATRTVVPHLDSAAVADVVNVSSMSGRRRPSAAMTVYSATKHAVHVLSAGLREELAPRGIRVTVLSPGFVATPIFQAGSQDERTRSYDRRARQLGLAPDVVAAQVVLALSQPPGVELVEVASISTRQTRE